MASDAFSFPEGPVPSFALRSAVLFPHSTLTVKVVRSSSVALFASSRAGDLVGAFYLRDADVDSPLDVDIHAIGTLARIVEVRRTERGLRVTLEGLSRFKFEGLAQREPYHLVRMQPLQELESDSDEARLRAETLRSQLKSMVGKNGGAMAEVLKRPGTAAQFGDRLAAGLGLDTDDGVSLLEIAHVPARLQRLTELLGRAAVQSQLRSDIEKQVRDEFGKHQRKAILREQMAAIQRELDDGEEDGPDELTRLKQSLDEAKLPEKARKVADRELKRLERSREQGPEGNVIRGYLETLASLPWSKSAEERKDIKKIAEVLDRDHEGLNEAKQRVLEYMAVRNLAEQAPATILCLSGPPGVGKTSLAKSIAEASGRPFARIALGGVRDEAELRGHRRTYVGALPGRIIKAVESTGANNPVILLDEIDKLGTAWGRSTESAMLEILDPEQNAHFVDHYVETEFDLSQVLFICTANDLAALSAPLRDRMEIVELSGYTASEKLDIARKHLLPRAIKDAGIPERSLSLDDQTIRQIIEDYTREAGVRQLRRSLERLTRSLALQIARGDIEDKDTLTKFSETELRKLLGRPKFRNEQVEEARPPGVATGMAWTPFGGDILYVETSRMPGQGKLTITGQLGDVMKESAQAALSYVRSHAQELGLDELKLNEYDLHIHVPAGAVPKDGPSAGVTMFTALTSLLTGRAVRSDTAMTGEATLRGRVLPVGGIKAKVLAAHRAGIRRILLPYDNREDLEDVPVEVREDLEIFAVKDMSEVLKATLADDPSIDPGASSTRDGEASDIAEGGLQGTA